MGSWAQLTPPGIQSHSSGDPLPAQARSHSAHALPGPRSPESHIVACFIPGPTSWVWDGHFALGLTLPRMSPAVSHLAVPPRLCFPFSVTVKLFFPSVPTNQGQEGRWGHLCQVPLKIPTVSRLVPWGNHPAFLPCSQRLWLQALPPSFPL